MSVQVSEDQEDGILILRIGGRLDAASSPLLERQVNTYIDSGNMKLLLNFEHVEYLSSAGMRLLLSVGKKLKSKAGKMVIAAVSSEVMDVIKMAGFDHILNISPTEADAKHAF